MPRSTMPAPPENGLILTLDTGSPIVSVALGRPPVVLAERCVAQARSSERLVGSIDELLRQVGGAPGELDGVVALRGPGSFTGLRIGMATAMGLHQALGIPASTLPTLEVLASCAPSDRQGTVLAVIDALRDEWSAQPYAAGGPPKPLAEPTVESAATLGRHAATLVVGFGAQRLVDALPGQAAVEALEPTSLAAATVRLLGLRPPSWSAAELMDPAYLRPPAAVPSTAGRKG